MRVLGYRRAGLLAFSADDRWKLQGIRAATIADCGLRFGSQEHEDIFEVYMILQQHTHV